MSDLGSQKIGSNYQKLLQISESGIVADGSGSYSIIDVETGETLIPFSDYSLLSTDPYSNYFKLKLDGFINNRLYRILLRLRLNDGRYRIFDNVFKFNLKK